MVEIALRSASEGEPLLKLADAFDFEVSPEQLRIPRFSEAVAIRNVVSDSSLGRRLHTAIRNQVTTGATIDLAVSLKRAAIAEL